MILPYAISIVVYQVQVVDSSYKYQIRIDGFLMIDRNILKVFDVISIVFSQLVVQVRFSEIAVA